MTAVQKNNQHHLIVIGGPTASGKTGLAIQIAKDFGAEIISADSRQFYREMTIGTAKPSPEELQQVPHHFINSLSITDDYSVGDFEQQAMATIRQLHLCNPVVVVAGGSGLFINALCNGIDHFPEVDPAVKELIQSKYEHAGISWLQSELKKLDPDFFSKVDLHNPARLRRALEVCISAGQPYSSYLGKSSITRDFQLHYILNEWPRDVLYERINSRVDQMIEFGLEEEVIRLRPFEHRTALKTVGYEEWIDYFEGISSKAVVIEKIKQHSRNYAKRQLTWFRKYGQWEPVPNADSDIALDILRSKIKAP